MATNWHHRFESKILKRVLAHVPTYGEPGSFISFSRFMRDYCTTCGEPVRVNATGGTTSPKCSYCTAAEHPGQGSSVGAKEDANPWQENAIKDLES